MNLFIKGVFTLISIRLKLTVRESKVPTTYIQMFDISFAAIMFLKGKFSLFFDATLSVSWLKVISFKNQNEIRDGCGFWIGSNIGYKRWSNYFYRAVNINFLSINVTILKKLRMIIKSWTTVVLFTIILFFLIITKKLLFFLVFVVFFV